MEKIFKAQLILSAMDNASRVINSMSNNAITKMTNIQKKTNEMAGQAFKVGQQSAMISASIAAPLIAAGTAAVDFEKQMSNVNTLLNEKEESIVEIGKSLIEVSKRVPANIDDLTSALYDVRSAGIEAKDSMAVLEKSAVLATTGLATTKEATNLMTSAINAFADEGMTADEIANILFKTVKAGKTDISQLAIAFGATAPVIQSVGVTLADYQAATAALTTVGNPASQAQNQLKQAMVGLQKPSKEMIEVFKLLNVKTGKELIETSGGIGAAFELVTEKAKANNISVEKLFGSQEAAAAMTSLLGSRNEIYNKTLVDMRSGTDAITGAMEKQMSTASASLQIAKNEAMALAITVGQNLIPIMTDLLTSLKPIINNVSNWVKENPKLVSQIVKIAAGAAALAAGVSALSFVFGGALKAVSFVIGGLKMLVTVIRVVTIAMMSNPIIAIITAIAIAAGLIYVYWDPIKKFFLDLWDGIKNIFNSVMAWFTGLGETFYNAGVNIVKSIWKGMKDVASMPVDAIKSITKEMRDYLPFSPAKKGAFKDIHRVKIVETIADSMKPNSLIDKIKQTTNMAMNVVGGGGGQKTAINTTSPAMAGGGITVNFSPTIYADGNNKTGIIDAIKSNMGELVRMIDQQKTKAKRKEY